MYMASQETLNRDPKKSLKKKKNVGQLTFPDFITYYKATTIKVVLYLSKGKHANQYIE